MLLACAILFASASALGQQPATITGRVFDSFHRPVPGARVVPMERRVEKGKPRLVPGQPQALVDSAGMYRLPVPPGRYTLAVIPPATPLDFAAAFPAYLGDIVDAEQAPSIDVHAGELRPFVDFLLLEVEPHRVSGHVIGGKTPVTVTLYAASGYAGPLRTVVTDNQGRFVFDRIPAGSYELKATGPGYGSIHIELQAPEIRDLQIQLRPGAR
jgi:hypothetical protein